MRKPAAKRLFVFILCVALIMASLLSVAFVSAHMGHRHDHNGLGGCCATCAHMTAAQELLRQLAGAVAVAIVALAGLFVLLSGDKANLPRCGGVTPVQLCVRLNN